LGDDFRVFVLDIPLFFMQRDSSRVAVRQAMLDFGEEVTAVNDEIRVLPDEIRCSNYPNPFNSSTVIHFAIPVEADVEIGLFDLLGREIDKLMLGRLPAGSAEIRWDAKDLPSGLYIYQIKTNEKTKSGRMLLLK
jgi:hypothetical protein